jgi:hypothetical protein
MPPKDRSEWTTRTRSRTTRFDDGLVLACQSHLLTDSVVLDFDAT